MQPQHPNVQVWGSCDPGGSGFLSRDGVYKSLALTALAQQGKGADVRALASYGEGGKGQREGEGGRCVQWSSMHVYSVLLH